MLVRIRADKNCKGLERYLLEGVKKEDKKTSNYPNPSSPRNRRGGKDE